MTLLSLHGTVFRGSPWIMSAEVLLSSTLIGLSTGGQPLSRSFTQRVPMCPFCEGFAVVLFEEVITTLEEPLALRCRSVDQKMLNKEVRHLERSSVRNFHNRFLLRSSAPWTPKIPKVIPKEKAPHVFGLVCEVSV
ncbi:unnamed protein product [Symbiodinium natans]|uniref:Uncharacterized protein n=1 Tax=Symbiodinium natans TaxID=878477 RepID=A0A812U3J0_9DINO|nr:unnamed protein product [Symbiodinium natans]